MSNDTPKKPSINYAEDRLNSLRSKIDNEPNLSRIGKLITYASLISLAITLSGATVEKANTFLFEIQFKSPKGLSVLLVLALVFLLIRYHGFASIFLKDLIQLSRDRYENTPALRFKGKSGAALMEVIGKTLPKGEVLQEPHEIGITLIPRPLLKMRLEIRYTNKQRLKCTKRIQLEGGPFKIDKTTRIRLLLSWYTSKITNYTNHPDHLNLLAPYFIGVIALATMLTSFIKPDLIPSLIKLLG